MIPLLVPVGLGLIGGYLSQDSTEKFAGGGGVDEKYDWVKGSISGLKSKEIAEIKKKELESDKKYIRNVEIVEVPYSWGIDYRISYEYLARLIKRAESGGIDKNKNIYEGKSILLLSVPSPKFEKYYNKEVVIEKIEGDKITKSFLRSTGEKVPFVIDSKFAFIDY
jgi:hypothetical protein